MKNLFRLSRYWKRRKEILFGEKRNEDHMLRMRILLPLFVVFPCAAYQNAWFPLVPAGWGGHGGPHLKVTTMDGRNALLGGGLIAISPNPSFSWVASADYLEDEVGGLAFGYGALGVEQLFRAGSTLQPIIQAQAGFGLGRKDGETGPAYVGELAGLLGIQLGLGERLSLGLGYREVEVHGVPGITESSLDGWQLKVRLSYGIFDFRERPGPAAPRSPVFTGIYGVKASLLNGQAALLDGVGIAVLVDRRLAVGLSGFRVRNEVRYRGDRFDMGYGGLFARYLVAADRIVHGAATVLAGLGGAGYEEEASGETPAGLLPVLEGEAMLGVNLTEFLRIYLGAGYRWVPVGFEGLDPVDLGGPISSITLAAGAF
jgi:hypothetical protein